MLALVLLQIRVFKDSMHSTGWGGEGGIIMAYLAKHTSEVRGNVTLVSAVASSCSSRSIVASSVGEGSATGGCSSPCSIVSVGEGVDPRSGWKYGGIGKEEAYSVVTGVLVQKVEH